MTRCPFFAPLFRIGGSRRLVRKLDAIQAQLTRMEKTMSADKNDILNEAKEIHAAITAAMKSKAADIAAAVAKAQAAWEAGNDADHADAMAELQAIKAELANPPVFSPSGN